MSRKASTRCQATGSQPPRGSRSGSYPGVHRPFASGHRPRTGSRETRTWDGAQAASSRPAPPDPLRSAPAKTRRSPAPPGRLEPPPSRGHPDPGADPTRRLPRPPPTDLLPPTRGEPHPVPRSTTATPGADQATARPLWLRLPGPAPRPPSTNRQARPRPCGLRVEATRPRAPPAVPEATRCTRYSVRDGGVGNVTWPPLQGSIYPRRPAREGLHSCHGLCGTDRRTLSILLTGITPSPAGPVNSVLGFHYHFNKLHCVRFQWLDV